MPIQDDAPKQGERGYNRLQNLFEEFQAHRDALREQAGIPEHLRTEEYEAKVLALRDAKNDAERNLRQFIRSKPRLADDAADLGYQWAERLVEEREGQQADEGVSDERERTGSGSETVRSGGSGGTGGGGGGGGGNGNEKIDHLPGKEGKDYHFVKGPGGRVHVIFDMDIPGPKKGSISFSVPKELYDRYGVDPSKVKRLTAEQMKKLKGFGPINEIKLRRGEHPFQSWLREMKGKFGMAPSMLRDKEVMQKLYAAHLGQWDQAQLIGELQQTKWYDNKTKARVDYLFKMGTADKKTAINSNFNQIQSFVRSAFGGVDWTAHGINEAKLKDWAQNVVSGKTGWDMTEVQSRIEEIARGIEGTSLWASEEQAAEGALAEAQEWEDIFEAYRTKNLTWLGPHARSSQDTITDFAKKRASGAITDADYDQFLREQKKALHPYITNPDTPWQVFADSYRGVIENVTGTTTDWTDKYLADLGGKDANGNPTGQAMSLSTFAQYLRDNDPRFWDNPETEERGRALGQEVLSLMGGIR